MPFNFQVQESLFLPVAKRNHRHSGTQESTRDESLFKATLWLSGISTEAGEKTKWVVRCRRNGREISVNYRVEPFRGWDECEVFVTRHRSRLLFLVLNINNPAPSFATPSFVPPSPSSFSFSSSSSHLSFHDTRWIARETTLLIMLTGWFHHRHRYEKLIVPRDRDDVKINSQISTEGRLFIIISFFFNEGKQTFSFHSYVLSRNISSKRQVPRLLSQQRFRKIEGW